MAGFGESLQPMAMSQIVIQSQKESQCVCRILSGKHPVRIGLAFLGVGMMIFASSTKHLLARYTTGRTWLSDISCPHM
jgi:hypothetical protein